MTEYTIESIVAGESWGCQFRVHTFVDKDGQPIDTTNLQVGQPVVGGEPGYYENFGVIQTRDTRKRLVEVYDPKQERTWIVGWDDVWAVDRVEWRD